MRPALLRISIAFCFIYLSTQLSAQNCFNTGLNGTVINLPCNQNCVNVPVRIPHLKSTDTYSVVSVPYAPFPYVSAAPALTVPGCASQDDKFFDTSFIPFTFCFYGGQYTKLIVSTNGLVTFDSTNALKGSNWQLTTTSQIPLTGAGGTGTGTCPTPGGTLIPRAAILGAYYDLYIDATNFPNRKMQVEVYGSAPCRKFVISYFEIPLFSCNSVAGTQQIVLYESTGLIDVYIANKPACTFNGGLAILGVQNWNRDQAVTAPGKNCTVWNESNTGYRFVPSGGTSRFVKCEVYTIGGTIPLAIGDTVTTVPGTLDVTFPTFCPTGTGGQYVVKTIFSACDNASNQIISYDTITINKTSSLNATAATTQTACGATGSGTATITVPAGIGTAPYTFVLNPAGTTLTGSSPQQFTGLTAGNYTVVVTDAGGCSSTVPVTITSTGVLAVTYNVTNTTCVGANNGSVTVNPPNGTPPITYSINGGPLTSSNVFPNLLPGTYFISTQDAAGCQANFIPVTVNSGASITMTTSTTPTSCPGAANGSITITGSTGTAPYLYSINGGPYQAGNTFTGLIAGTYFISLADASGCTITFIPVTVSDGAGTVAGTAATTAPSCTGASNGTITVTPTSGTGPYQYSLNGGPYQSSNVFTGLAPGSYTVLIKEAGLCTSAPIPVTISAGGALLANVTSGTTSCNGAADGTITVTPTNGSTPYQYSLDGGPNQASNIFNGVSSGPHNIIVRDGAGCVSAAIPVTVTAGPVLTGTATSTATACTGVNNGTITATSTNGTGPYQYSLDGGAPQASNTFTGVSAGPHNVVIRNTAGCISANIPVTVATGTALTATTATTSTACVGVNNGSITITPTNGNAPYQYSLDGGANQASNLFTGVSAGSHNVVVTDNLGCISAAIPVTVAAGTALTATSTSTATACVGVNNGSITVTPTNGSAPYQYSLDGGANQASNLFTGVSAGSHNVVVTDNLGCISAPIPVTVAAGTALTATSTSIATACVGVNNGSITVTPTNGSAPYQYSLDGGANQVNNLFAGVSAGSHNVVVTDNFGCISAPIPVTVAAGTALTATSTSTATACAGVNNGSITVTPTNGSAPYQYSLDGGANQASNLFTGVSAGPHNVVVRDNFGCISVPIPVTVATGAALTGNATSTATTCNGASNGTITATATNGSGPYQYSLDGGANQASNIFTGVTSGSHNIVIRDNFGCISAAIPVTVTAGNSLNATTAAISTTCGGASNGSITVAAPTNGTAPYQYSLNGGAPQASPVFNGLAAAAYTINVTDGGGCSSGILPVTVTAGPAISETLNKTDVTCFGSATGTITVTASANATAPIQYSLNNVTWQASPNFTGLAANTYTVYIRDAVGCSNSSTITVGQPSQLLATTSAQSVLCNSASNGVIVVNAAGGTSAYTYSLNNITYQPGNSFNVAAGIYTVYVKDANGCIVQVNNVNVTQPAVLTATAATTNATCDGGNNGAITVTTTGGVSSYQYSSDGTTFQASNTLNVGPGTYTVTVKDINGCTYTIPGVVVGLTNNLTYTPMIDPAAICESSSVQLQLVTNATQFAWTNGGSLSSSTVANPIAKPGASTSYMVTATLGRCTITDDVIVSIMPAPIPNAGPPGDICYGKTYQLQGSGGVTYVWTPSSYLSSTSVYNPVVTPDKTITYTLNVTDANGCASLVPVQVTVKVTPPIKVTVHPADTIVYAGAQIPLLATSAGTSYTWSTVTGLNNPNIPDPIATAPLADGSVVVYKVTATTSAGCQGEAYARIQVYKGPDLYMVTGFTPNGDGKNDVFIPFPVGVKQINYFRIVNRWGQLIYETKELNKGWDGRFSGKEQPSGVYVWMVEGVTMDNKLITKKGTVTLVR
jgi:gliding motility-associated-like protein